MTHETENKSDTIIDLDADQVVEDVERSATNSTATASIRPSRKRNWLLATVALLAAFAAGGWLYKDMLSVYLPSNQVLAMADKIAVLEGSNTTLRGQLTSVEKLAAQLKSDIDGMEARDAEMSSFAEAAEKSQIQVSDKVSALEQALGETKTAVAKLAARPVVSADGTPAPVDNTAIAALQQRMETLENDVASLKAKPAEAPDNRAALSQGLSDLKAKIAAGTGYLEEYGNLNRMVPAASGLDLLQRHAALGLPNAQGLAAELRGLIGYLPKPIIPGPVPESQSWWSGIYDSLSGLITIRIEGDVDWPSAASAAAALAESGDVPQSIAQLSGIEGVKPGGVQQWIDRANGRLALEAALKSVEEAVLRVIAAKG